jgi:hypothetical protein
MGRILTSGQFLKYTDSSFGFPKGSDARRKEQHTMAKKKRTAPRKTQKKGGKTRKKLRPGLKKGKRGPMGVLGKGPMGVLGKGP